MYKYIYIYIPVGLQGVHSRFQILDSMFYILGSAYSSNWQQHQQNRKEWNRIEQNRIESNKQKCLPLKRGQGDNHNNNNNNKNNNNNNKNKKNDDNDNDSKQ